jgi:hypothetical protein
VPVGCEPPRIFPASRYPFFVPANQGTYQSYSARYDDIIFVQTLKVSKAQCTFNIRVIYGKDGK